MTTPSPYTWISRRPDSWVNQLTNATESGVVVSALWNATQTPIVLKVPQAQYTPDEVNRLILAAGAKEDAMAALGAPPAV